MIVYTIHKEDSAETRVCKIAINTLERILGEIPGCLTPRSVGCEICSRARALAIGALIDIGDIGINLD